MRRVSIIEVDQYLNSNLYNKLTKVHYNIVENDQVTSYRNAELKGRISGNKARQILDTLYMTNAEYLETHKVPLDKNLQSKYIEFCHDYDNY